MNLEKKGNNKHQPDYSLVSRPPSLRLTSPNISAFAWFVECAVDDIYRPTTRFSIPFPSPSVIALVFASSGRRCPLLFPSAALPISPSRAPLPLLALVGRPSLQLVQRLTLSRSLIVGLVESEYLQGQGSG